MDLKVLRLGNSIPNLERQLELIYKQLEIDSPVGCWKQYDPINILSLVQALI